ncbi:MAG: chromatin protein Cren7 [Desulfurococcales archaeon]|nr:chromatin protein Cren7 [Desulfurococcales archaeon]
MPRGTSDGEDLDSLAEILRDLIGRGVDEGVSRVEVVDRLSALLLKGVLEAPENLVETLLEETLGREEECPAVEVEEPFSHDKLKLEPIIVLARPKEGGGEVKVGLFRHPEESRYFLAELTSDYPEQCVSHINSCAISIMEILRRVAGEEFKIAWKYNRLDGGGEERRSSLKIMSNLHLLRSGAFSLYTVASVMVAYLHLLLLRLREALASRSSEDSGKGGEESPQQDITVFREALVAAVRHLVLGAGLLLDLPLLIIDALADCWESEIRLSTSN